MKKNDVFNVYSGCFENQETRSIMLILNVARINPLPYDFLFNFME